MITLSEDLKDICTKITCAVLAGGFLVSAVVGLDYFEKRVTLSRIMHNCREKIKYYYKQEPQNFCQDSCTAENLFRLIDIYDGKIDLNRAYEIAKKRCETQK